MASSSQTFASIEEVNDTTQPDDDEHASSGSEQDEDVPESSSAPSTSTAPAEGGKKKKKKKKSKAGRALAALAGGKDALPQELVDQVLDQVTKERGDVIDGKKVDEAEVRKAMQAMKIMDVLKGKTGIGGKNRKDMGEHKVGWFIHRFQVTYVLTRYMREHNSFGRRNLYHRLVGNLE